MTNHFHKLLPTIASVGQRELSRQVRDFKAENETLRGRLPGRVLATRPNEPVCFDTQKAAGSSIHRLATIVSPPTLGNVRCRARLGGPLTSYSRGAAKPAVTFRFTSRQRSRPDILRGCHVLNQITRPDAIERQFP